MFTCKIIDTVGLTGQTIFLDVIAAVAGAALAVMAFNAYRTGVRTKRKDTLEALGKWVDDTREARIDVVDVPGKPGAYRAVAFLRPHYQLDELSVSLRLVAELPPPAGQ